MIPLKKFYDVIFHEGGATYTADPNPKPPRKAPKRDKLYVALLVLIVAAGIGTREYQSHKINAFNPDGIYIDTLPQDHSRLEPITSDTATPETQRIYDSMVKAQEAVDSATRPRDSETVDADGARFRHHDGRIIAGQPNATWFWIVFDSVAWKQSKWKNEPPIYPKDAKLTMTRN